MARVSETDRVAGLDLGADDYITKPFSVREVMARVRAVLRRVDENQSARYEDNRLRVDFADMQVMCDGESVRLTRREFALLSMLANSARPCRHAPATLGRRLGTPVLRRHAHARSSYSSSQAKARRACDMCIETVVGVGYRFVGYHENSDK